MRFPVTKLSPNAGFESEELTYIHASMPLSLVFLWVMASIIITSIMYVLLSWFGG